MSSNLMNRVDTLILICKEFHYEKLVRRLSEAELIECEEFCRDNQPLGHLEFEYEANRWYLDNPKKPKHLSIMVELVGVANDRFIKLSKIREGGNKK
jgi:hypothetical protein